MARIVRQESETVEFKERWTDSTLEALAAFANHKGRTVYMGIADDGRPVGCNVSDDEQKRIVNQVVQTLGLRPRVRVEKRTRTNILVLQVEPTTIPTPCRGRYFTRVGTTNRDMTPDQVGWRLMEQLGESWDGLPSKVPLKDLNNAAFRRREEALESAWANFAQHPSAAAKIYRALAMRILEAGKSKYYSFALEHLRTAKRLYGKLEEHKEWQMIVDQIRRVHARKRGFIADFEEIVANRKVKPPESFADRSRRRWKQQTAE